VTVATISVTAAMSIVSGHEEGGETSNEQMQRSATILYQSPNKIEHITLSN
jgi:hypothetical protein